LGAMGVKAARKYVGEIEPMFQAKVAPCERSIEVWQSERAAKVDVFY